MVTIGFVLKLIHRPPGLRFEYPAEQAPTSEEGALQEDYIRASPEDVTG
jgi:hypothetical protein